MTVVVAVAGTSVGGDGDGGDSGGGDKTSNYGDSGDGE